MLACPSSPPLQARIALRDVHRDSDSSFVRITRSLRRHRSECLEMPQAVFFSKCARQAKSVTFWLRIGREPNRIGLIEWPYFFRANIAATEPVPHNGLQKYGKSEVIKHHNRRLSRSNRITGIHINTMIWDPPEKILASLCSLQCSLALNSESLRDVNPAPPIGLDRFA